MAMRIAITPSIQRSTVHHQTPSGERSERGKAWAWEGEVIERAPAMTPFP
jgi:hypothetical protein